MGAVACAYFVNIEAADHLATQGAWASALVDVAPQGRCQDFKKTII